MSREENCIELYEKYMKQSMREYKKSLGSASIELLHSLKQYLDDLYYNSGDTEFSDEKYDLLKEFLVANDSSYKVPIGAKVKIHDEVKLPFFMGSCDKITPDEQKVLDRWSTKNKSTRCVITEKLDGVSVMLHITKKEGYKLFKRGNGVTGNEISYLIQYIKHIPTNIKKDISIRGELIIPKKVFDTKHSKTYKNPRNMVSGLTSSKTIKDEVSDINFVSYEIMGNETLPSQSEQIKRLKDMGFITAMHEIVNSSDIKTTEDLTEIHDKFKEKTIYEIDGIVIQADVPYDLNRKDNPEYSFAFKVRSDENLAETTVLDIEWNVSKNGMIIPVYIIQPVKLSGVTISRVSGHNAGLMVKNGIGKNSIVKVTRSKDVIPHIFSVVKKCEPKFPDIDYEWDENHVNILVKNPELDEDITKEMLIKLFSSFFSKMDIKHVSDETIRKIYDYGITTLFGIIAVKKETLVKIDGIQAKSAERIVENIKNGLVGVKPAKLISAAGVLGVGIGERKIEALLRDIPDLLSCNDKKGLKNRILKVEGFSDKTCDKILDNLDNAIGFIDEISKYASFAIPSRISDSLIGKVFVMTGFRSADLEKSIVDRGGKCGTSVSKKTSGIIVSSKNSGSSKEQKAEELGIPIYTKDEFIEEFIE